MAKEINYGVDAKNKMINGINKVANAVEITIGPKGKCVAIQGGFNVPDITRDGATVAKSIDLKDPIENMGAQLVKKAAQRTEELAGDGTSSTAILTKELISKGQKYSISSDQINLNEVKQGMDTAVKLITDYIKDHSISVDGDLEKIRKVSTISANNDPEVGDLIVSCMEKVGQDGVITADVSSGLDTTIDVVQGLKIDRGWASPHFITSPEEGKCIMEDVKVLIVGEKLSNIPQIVNILEEIAKNGSPLLIICDDIDEIVLTTLVMNVLRGALRCCVVKGIDYGDARKNLMEDISVAVGAQYICPEYGINVSDATIDYLGVAKKVVVSKDSCIIYEGQGDEEQIKERLEILKKRYEDPNISDYEKTKFQKRISGLSGGIGIIKAGGASEVEKTNKKATIEDAILASKSAISEGVVSGGGSLFYKIYKNKENFLKLIESQTVDVQLGFKIVFESLPIIVKTIAKNAGFNGDTIAFRLDEIYNSENTLKEKNNKEEFFGFNAKNNTFGNLIEMGILDSAKVLRVSLENAVSAASMCLLTECTITEELIDNNNNNCCNCNK